MKQAIALLLTSGALGLGGATFAEAAQASVHAFVFEGPAAGMAAQIWTVSDDDDEDENEGRSWFGSDDDDEDSEDCDDEHDDEGGCAAGGVGNAAPAGSVAPPKNGLFTDGTAPQAQTN